MFLNFLITGSLLLLIQQICAGDRRRSWESPGTYFSRLKRLHYQYFLRDDSKGTAAPFLKLGSAHHWEYILLFCCWISSSRISNLLMYPSRLNDMTLAIVRREFVTAKVTSKSTSLHYSIPRSQIDLHIFEHIVFQSDSFQLFNYVLVAPQILLG